MGKRWKIGLGVVAGVYAVAQAVRLFIVATSTGTDRDLWTTTAPARASPAAQSFAAGTFLGSVIGLAIGAVVCTLLLWSAFGSSAAGVVQRPTPPRQRSENDWG